jgi:ketosteroid isomerase-like protein
MKRVFCSVTLLAATSILLAQSKGEQEIQAAEQAWADSYQSCDVAKMRTLLSDDVTVITHITGAAIDKQAFMQGMASCSIVKVMNSPTRIRVYGDTAAVQGRSTYNMKNGGPPIFVVYTRVWARTNGQWQIVNHQSTGASAPQQ